MGSHILYYCSGYHCLFSGERYNVGVSPARFCFSHVEKKSVEGNLACVSDMSEASLPHGILRTLCNFHVHLLSLLLIDQAHKHLWCGEPENTRPGFWIKSRLGGVNVNAES